MEAEGITIGQMTGQASIGSRIRAVGQRQFDGSPLNSNRGGPVRCTVA